MKNGKKIARAFPQYEFGTSGNGSDFVLVTFAILEGSDAGETLSWYGYFTEATQERTIESLRICGWGGDNITELQGIDRNAVELVVENDTYEGKTRPKIKWVNRLGGGGIKPDQQMDDGKRAAFAARMRGAVMAVPASMANEGMRYDTTVHGRGDSGAKPGGGDPGGYSGDPGVGDDDLPF